MAEALRRAADERRERVWKALAQLPEIEAKKKADEKGKARVDDCPGGAGHEDGRRRRPAGLQ